MAVAPRYNASKPPSWRTTWRSTPHGPLNSARPARTSAGLYTTPGSGFAPPCACSLRAPQRRGLGNATATSASPSCCYGAVHAPPALQQLCGRGQERHRHASHAACQHRLAHSQRHTCDGSHARLGVPRSATLAFRVPHLLQSPATNQQPTFWRQHALCGPPRAKQSCVECGHREKRCGHAMIEPQRAVCSHDAPRCTHGCTTCAACLRHLHPHLDCVKGVACSGGSAWSCEGAQHAARRGGCGTHQQAAG